MSGEDVMRGDVFRDAPNSQGLARTLRVHTFFRGSVMLHEEGTQRYPQVPLDRLLDERYFVRVDEASGAA